MKRLLSLCAAALLLPALVSCEKKTSEVSQTSTTASGESRPAETTGLKIPEFSKFNHELRNTEYTLTLQEAEGAPQEIVPYNVKITPNRTQNV